MKARKRPQVQQINREELSDSDTRNKLTVKINNVDINEESEEHQADFVLDHAA